MSSREFFAHEPNIGVVKVIKGRGGRSLRYVSAEVLVPVVEGSARQLRVKGRAGHGTRGRRTCPGRGADCRPECLVGTYDRLGQQIQELLLSNARLERGANRFGERAGGVWGGKEKFQIEDDCPAAKKRERLGRSAPIPT